MSLSDGLEWRGKNISRGYLQTLFSEDVTHLSFLIPNRALVSFPLALNFICNAQSLLSIESGSSLLRV